MYFTNLQNIYWTTTAHRPFSSAHLLFSKSLSSNKSANLRVIYYTANEKRRIALQRQLFRSYYFLLINRMMQMMLPLDSRLVE